MSLIENTVDNKPGFPRSDATNAYDLLTDVIQCIEREPRRLHMQHWLLTGEYLEAELDGEDGPICGTAGCVAGIITLLTVPIQDIDFTRDAVKHNDVHHSVREYASRLLSLTTVGLFNGVVLAPGHEDDEDYVIPYGHP